MSPIPQDFDVKKIQELLSNKAVTQLAGVILIAILYLFFIFFPKAKVVLKNFSQAGELKAKIVKIESAWAQRTQIEQKIAQTNEKIHYYEKELPGKKEIPQVLRYLSDSARKLNVKITEIKPAEEDEGIAEENLIYSSVPISLKAECGYHELGRFVSELESADRFVKIGDIKILTNPYNENRHHVRLMVITYTLRQ